MKIYQFPCGCAFNVLKDSPEQDVIPQLDFDIENIPDDCSATWEMLAKGLTKGVFQLESSLGKTWTKKLKPTCLEHMGALGALLRPGPLRAVDEHGVSMTEHYCRRKNGLEEVAAYHPAVDKILKGTYNTLCFQEQIMFLGRDIAGFNEVSVDKLRKSVGKKDQVALAKVRDEFLEGAEKTQVVTKAQAEEIWGWIQKSGRYSFNRCVAYDTIIRRASINGKYGNNERTVEEMYRIRNDRQYAKQTNHFPLFRKWQRIGNYGKGMSMCEDGRIRPNVILDIQPSGKQIVFKIVLVNGKVIRATGTHSFPTNKGKLTVAEMIGQIGVSLYICGSYEHTKNNYAFSDITIEERRNRNDNRLLAVNGCFEHKNWAYTNGSYTDFKNNKKQLPVTCSDCGKRHRRPETHHIDGNRSNSKLENLVRLCPSCHKKREYQSGRVRKYGKGYPSLLVSIKEIIPDGECETYDVTMEGPNHNFVTGDSIVTCNSHADSYGICGYRTAYIKAHFPIPFFASWLKHSKLKQDPQQEVMELVNEARLFDIAVEPPDLRSPQYEVHIDRNTIKFGLTNIKGIGGSQASKLGVALEETKSFFAKPVKDWSWWEFLVHFTPKLSSVVINNLISVGALRQFSMPRMQMLAEYAVFDSLTEREVSWIQERYRQFHGLLPALKALSNPRSRNRVHTKILHRPKVGMEEVVKELEKEYEALCRHRDDIIMTYEGGDEDEEGLLAEADITLDTLIDENRKNYASAVTEEKVKSVETNDEPGFVPGGCANVKREAVVRSQVYLLEHPPTPLTDSPHIIADFEEKLIGISLTCSKIDSCDISEVNCSCKEFMAGRKGLVIIGGEVQEIRELKTKKGKTPGAKMAYLTLTDGTCALTDIVCFPDVWKDARSVMTQGNTVIIKGERDYKDKDSSQLIVKKVWQTSQT